ncbi:MAG: hypothetical protein ACM3H7_04035 [Acidobacteriaceae bacterium]
MVHALKEAYRVLVPHGIMIDVRPLSTDGPLEIINDGRHESAGMIDMSPGLVLDEEADQAVETVKNDHLFKEIKLEYFNFTYYWDTVDGMEEDMEENWQGEVVITEKTWNQARQLFSLGGPDSKVRMACRMKLGVYAKNR